MLKKVNVGSFCLPINLIAENEECVHKLSKELKEIRHRVDAVNKELVSLGYGILDQISRSEDVVSKTLTPIFAKAVPHTNDELERAKERKRRGVSPGKKGDPLGDELTWEQILTHIKGKSKLWIITRDGDFATAWNDDSAKASLNALLRQELLDLHQAKIQVFCFRHITDGLEHFATTMNVSTEELFTPEEKDRTNREQDALPPLNYRYASTSNEVALRSYSQRSDSTIRAAMNYGSFLPPGDSDNMAE
jgi:hypothetical protein